MSDSKQTASKHPIGWSPEEQWGGIERGDPTSSPTEIYREQRERCPVAWRSFDDGQGFWNAFGYDDVVAVLEDPATFSSATSKYSITLIPIEVDPPDHRKYRVLLSQLINPMRLQQYEAGIREFVRAQLGKVLAHEADLLAVTAAIPIHAFCMMLGDPNTDAFRQISERREATNDPRLSRQDAASTATRIAANQPLVDYCQAQVASHRANPRDDIVSDILSGQIDGRPITDDEALSMLSLLYIAGNRTTQAALRGSVIQLGRNPHIQQILRENPAKIPAAIEEIVRLESPVHALPRYATKDTEIRGCPIAAGEQIFPNYGAANVDPAMFDRPEDIDLNRRPIRHVGFGRGIHICAGAPLARLQLRVFIEELLSHTAAFKLTGPVSRMRWPHFGATSLPVEITPRPMPPLANHEA